MASIVAMLLFCASIYVLARADRWSKSKAGILAGGMLVLLFLALSLAYQPGWQGWVVQLISKGVSIAVMIVLFGLAKSVSNRVPKDV